MQPQTFVFFGIVGSGKGTQVKFLTNFLKGKDGRECVYIGTGEIFRKMIESAKNDFEIKLAREIFSGRLVPDEFTNKLVWETVELNFSLEKHLIFDGYPRTINQSEVFEKKIPAYLKNVKVVYLELSEEEAIKRNLLRGRHDDTEEGLRKRFEEYKDKVIPAMNYFKDKENYEILTINGEQSVENVHGDIIKALGF